MTERQYGYIVFGKFVLPITEMALRDGNLVCIAVKQPHTPAIGPYKGAVTLFGEDGRGVLQHAVEMDIPYIGVDEMLTVTSSFRVGEVIPGEVTYSEREL